MRGCEQYRDGPPPPQTDPDGDTLPQINPALFLSPGGRRFKDLLLGLTQFVMIKAMRKLGNFRFILRKYFLTQELRSKMKKGA